MSASNVNECICKESKSRKFNKNEIDASKSNVSNSTEIVNTKKASASISAIVSTSRAMPLFNDASCDKPIPQRKHGLLYTSDAADELLRVDIGGRRDAQRHNENTTST